MNFFNRALKYILVRKTKTFLLMVTFLLIGNLVITGLGISMASENAKKLTRQKMRPVVGYEVNYNAINKYVEELSNEERDAFYQEYPSISKEVAMKIADSEYVKAVNTSYERLYFNVDFEALPAINPREENKYDDGFDMGYVYVEPPIKVLGNVFPNMIELETSDYEIVEGRFYNQDEVDTNAAVAVVEATLASLNGLGIGDTFTINQMDDSRADEVGIDPADYSMDFTIIGIYKNNKELDPNSPEYDWMTQTAYNTPGNTILVPSTTLVDKEYELMIIQRNKYIEENPDYADDWKIPSKEEYMSYYYVTYLLNDPLDVDKFVKEYTPLLDSEFTYLNANDKVFKKLAKPLDTISLFSNIIVYVVLFNAIVIISLITALTLKNREYEIGVLLSLGVSKLKIVGQLFTELLIISLIGFLIATVSGTFISKAIGQQVLDYQIETQDNNDEYQYDYDYSPSQNYFTEISQDDLLGEYEVKMSGMLIGEIILIGVGVVFISILIPLLMVLRLNPRAIMLRTN